MLAAVLFVACGCLPASKNATLDSFEMRVVARLPYAPEYNLVCSDADHDGNPEFFATGYPWRGYAFEHVGGSSFDSTVIINESSVFDAVGDGDHDGKTDLVLQAYASILRVFESPAPDSLPTREVWRDTVHGMPSFNYACLADIDRDSAMEMWVKDWPDLCVRVYENVSDNDYRLKARVRDSTHGIQSLAPVGDLDRDGKPEMALGEDGRGLVLFYETVADDSFERVAVDSTTHPQPYPSDIMAAPDMDRDGRSEALVLSYSQSDAVRLTIFESPGNDTFVAVWYICVSGSRGKCGRIGVGDVDGDSVPEFAFTDGRYVRLFRCTGNDRYEQMWQFENRALEVAVYDINADGKAELLYKDGTTSYLWTEIREYFSLGVQEQVRRGLGQVISGPSVVRRGGAVRLGTRDWGLGQDVEVEVVDAVGRCVLARTLDRLTAGPLSLDVSHVPPGIYFVRVSSSGHSVTRKVLILS